MFPSGGRIAGIDYGHVRIGVAITDPNRMVASPLETYTRRSIEADADYFVRLGEEEQVVGFVVGLPVHTSGDESGKSREARRFGQWLQEVTGKPVCFFDERYTTVQAQQMLTDAQLRGKKRKSRLDRVAAQILLAAFLESPSTADAPPQPLGD